MPCGLVNSPLPRPLAPISITRSSSIGLFLEHALSFTLRAAAPAHPDGRCGFGRPCRWLLLRCRAADDAPGCDPILGMDGAIELDGETQLIPNFRVQSSGKDIFKKCSSDNLREHMHETNF